MRPIFTALLSVLFAACFQAGPPPVAEPGPRPIACTEIGCESLLSIQLTDVDLEAGTAYDVEVCVDGECVVETVSGGADGTVGGIRLIPDLDLIEYPLSEDGYGEEVEVSFAISDDGGAILAEVAAEQVPLERNQPNGPGCPPVCFFGRLTV